MAPNPNPNPNPSPSPNPSPDHGPCLHLTDKPVDGLQVFLFLLYCLYFLYTAGVDVMSIFCLYMKNTGQAKQPPAAGPAPAKRDPAKKAASNS